jgi:signal transduction histidine kinase
MRRVKRWRLHWIPREWGPGILIWSTTLPAEPSSTIKYLATKLPSHRGALARFLAHIVEEDEQLVESALEKAAQSGSFEMECRINRRDGKVRWIAAKGRVGYDASKRPIRMAGILMDITERKQTEAALYKAQRMEAIGQLTGGVAHDFNNLLTVIVGGLDMIIRRPEQPQRVSHLAQAAMTAARRGEQLTQQLLAYSRRQMLRPETLNPNRLLLDFRGLAERAVGDSIKRSLTPAFIQYE